MAVMSQAIGADTPRTATREARLRRTRSPRLMAIGLLLTILGGLGSALLYSNASNSHPVVVMAQTVQRGETISRGDLTVTTIGGAPGVTTVPSSDMEGLVGQEALADLPAGSLPAAQSVGRAAVAPNTVQLGLRLEAGRLPVRTMPAGTPVTLVALRDTSSPDAKNVDYRVRAQVATAAQEASDGTAWLMDVAVPSLAAEQVAKLAATDRLVVVRQANS